MPLTERDTSYRNTNFTGDKTSPIRNKSFQTREFHNEAPRVRGYAHAKPFIETIYDTSGFVLLRIDIANGTILNGSRVVARAKGLVPRAELREMAYAWLESHNIRSFTRVETVRTTAKPRAIRVPREHLVEEALKRVKIIYL